MIADCLGRRGHRTQKFHVGLRFRQPADQQLHGLDRREWAQDLAQHPHAAQLIWWQKQFVLTRARALNVDSRKNALIGKAAVKIDFHVAGALELFEDDIVHAAARIDQRGGDDGERAALFHVARSGEEADRKSTRLNSSHVRISYAVFCLKKKKRMTNTSTTTHG